MMPWSHKKVLVVDDSETMRMFILFHLIKMLPGVQIIEAVNGLDAIEKLKDQDVDLILTDMNMPEMDGAGIIRAVRNVFNRKTPIIIITTKGEHGDSEQGLQLGANAYITKPLNPLEFRETVRRFIE